MSYRPTSMSFSILCQCLPAWSTLKSSTLFEYSDDASFFQNVRKKALNAKGSGWSIFHVTRNASKACFFTKNKKGSLHLSCSVLLNDPKNTFGMLIAERPLSLNQIGIFSIQYICSYFSKPLSPKLLYMFWLKWSACLKRKEHALSLLNCTCSLVLLFYRGVHILMILLFFRKGATSESILSERR